MGNCFLPGSRWQLSAVKQTKKILLRFKATMTISERNWLLQQFQVKYSIKQVNKKKKMSVHFSRFKNIAMLLQLLL